MEETTPPITPELALVDADLGRRARMLLPGPQDCLAARPVPHVRNQSAVPASATEQRHTRAPNRLDRAPLSLRPPLVTRIRSSALVLVVGVALVLAGLAGSQLVVSERDAGATSIETDGARASDVPGAATADVEVPAVEDDRQRGRQASQQQPATIMTTKTSNTRATSTSAARVREPGGPTAQPTTRTVRPPLRRQPPSATVTTSAATSAPRRPPSVPTKTARGSSSGTPQRQVAVVRWPSRSDADYYNLILVRGDQRIDLWPPKATATLKRFPSTKSTKKVVEYSWFAYPVFTDGQAVRYGPLLAHGTVAVVPGALKSQARPVNT